MKAIELSVTEAARNFADCVNRAHYQGQTFVLLKNGRPVARLTPAAEQKGNARELAKALATVGLTDSEATAWRKDIKSGRRSLKPPKNKWPS